MKNPDHALSDPEVLRGLVEEIVALSRRVGRPLAFMEVCGTHTHAVAAAGLRRMLPAAVKLISGPGCPVCVTPVAYLDRALALAELPDITLATFGDLMRVPSSTTTLEEARARGHRVEIVYSPRDAVDLARRAADRRIVFLAVGFETTIPTIAAALAEAEADGVENFLILPGNKIMPPPMAALSADPDLNIAGYLLPGHVAVISGWESFRFLAEEHGLAGAVVGFAPADVLQGVVELLRQTVEGRCEIANLYGRVVDGGGNTTARALIERFFEPVTTEWRGFGPVAGSGMALRPEWRHRNAGCISVDVPDPVEPVGCRCGEVLRGVADPPECPLFDAGCTPDDPVGACMVSSEGSCAAWYRHDRYGEVV